MGGLAAPRRARVPRVGERPEEVASSSQAAEPEQGQEKFGLTVQAITPELAARYSLRQTTGVVVTKVASGSRAYWAGIEVGDRDAGVDERRPLGHARGSSVRSAVDADDADLGHPVVGRPRPGGLQVDEREGGGEELHAG